MRALPTSKQLNLRVGLAGLGAGVFCAFLIVMYVQLVTRLSPAHVRFLWLEIAVVVTLFGVVSEFLKGRRLGKITHYLEHRDDGTLGDAERQAAFFQAIHFPAWLVTYSFVAWVAMGSSIAYLLDWRFEDLSTYSATLMTLSAIVGGFLSQTFVYLAMKFILEPVKNALALEIVDPELRANLVVPVPVSRKLMIDMCGLMLAVTFLSVTLSNSRAMRSVAGVLYDQHVTVLKILLQQLEAAEGAPEKIAEAQRALRAAYSGIGIDFVVLGDQPDAVLAGDLGVLRQDEREWLQQVALSDGSSAQFEQHNDGYDSPHLLTVLAGEGRRYVVVGISMRDHVRGSWTSENRFVLLLTLFSVITAVALAQMIAVDFRHEVGLLRAEVGRIARGDFTRSSVFESENEHGDLGRDMDRMLGSLRGIVRRVLQRVGQVRLGGAQIGTAAQAVAESSTQQRDGVVEAVRAMDDVNHRVAEIGDLANGLTVAVDTSSQTLDSLRRSSQGLSESGITLANQVEETASSIDELTRSIQGVAEEAQDLVLGVSETSSSIEEIASALRAVDRNASETQKLSGEALDAAEIGREKVAETIRGIEEIRRTTENAESVMQRLGERSQGIGTVVRVINDIADETNLLALNAAIIAAQAGEQGRAFSVVADEIKDLADRVLVSTKEIAALVDQLQKESAVAAHTIAAGTASVHSGVERAAVAGKALERITDAARESGERMQQVVLAVREQSAASVHMVELMERVRLGVDDIHRATQQQSKSASTVQRSAELMRDVAVQVRSAVDTQKHDHLGIQQDVESVSHSAKVIVEKLVQQSDACVHAAQVLDVVVRSVENNQRSVSDVQQALDALLAEADRLRKDAEEFQV